MRSTNKSRSRHKNNNNNNNNNNNRRSGGNIMNRVFDSAGPEGKVRGTPQQIVDKYQALARDSELNGDPVAVENFFQHSEHYSRLLSDGQREMAEQREAAEQRKAEFTAKREAEREARATENAETNVARDKTSEPVLEDVKEDTAADDLMGSEQPHIEDVAFVKTSLVEKRKPVKKRASKPREIEISTDVVE